MLWWNSDSIIGITLHDAACKLMFSLRKSFRELILSSILRLKMQCRDIYRLYQCYTVLHDSYDSALTLSCRMERLKPTLSKWKSLLIPLVLLAPFLQRTEHRSFIGQFQNIGIVLNFNSSFRSFIIHAIHDLDSFDSRSMCDAAEDLTSEFLPNTMATQTQIETLLHQKNMEQLCWGRMDWREMTWI